MSKNVNDVLNADVLGDTTSPLSLNGETNIFCYIFNESGEHNSHRIGLEVSPNGDDWLELPASVIGLGFMRADVLATHIRAKVFKAESEPSKVVLYLLAE